MRTDSARADRFDTGVDGTTGFENGGSGDDVFGDGTALDGPATGSDAEQFDTTENGREGDEPLLAVLGENYASTVIGFGWLSDMVAVGGPAGALRALDHYETIGWLGPEARAELESMLSGPGLDVDIDPNEPKELTAEEHALSYEYVRMLEAVDTLEDSF
jgi:archaellum component FlaD/FlaE